MNLQPPRFLHHDYIALCLALAILPALPAQQATKPTGSANPSSSDAIVLSPFEVATTQDTGYAGQDTLSGSRLRTNLKDIAAAISPMTAEFLEDIAATNIETAMEYGVGTRVETDDARAAGPVGISITMRCGPFVSGGCPAPRAASISLGLPEKWTCT
jgi:outer membrane receptor for ferric coprogen and ferric-rhodotorulic acid